MLQKMSKGAKKWRAQSRIEMLHKMSPNETIDCFFFPLQYYYFTLNFLMGSNMMSTQLYPLGFYFLVICM